MGLEIPNIGWLFHLKNISAIRMANRFGSVWEKFGVLVKEVDLLFDSIETPFIQDESTRLNTHIHRTTSDNCLVLWCISLSLAPWTFTPIVCWPFSVGNFLKWLLEERVDARSREFFSIRCWNDHLCVWLGAPAFATLLHPLCVRQCGVRKNIVKDQGEWLVFQRIRWYVLHFHVSEIEGGLLQIGTEVGRRLEAAGGICRFVHSGSQFRRGLIESLDGILGNGCSWSWLTLFMRAEIERLRSVVVLVSGIADVLAFDLAVSFTILWRYDKFLHLNLPYVYSPDGLLLVYWTTVHVHGLLLNGATRHLQRLREQAYSWL